MYIYIYTHTKAAGQLASTVFARAKRAADRATGFKTGSGQTGCSRKTTNPLHFTIFCFQCACVATFCNILSYLSYFATRPADALDAAGDPDPRATSASASGPGPRASASRTCTPWGCAWAAARVATLRAKIVCLMYYVLFLYITLGAKTSPRSYSDIPCLLGLHPLRIRGGAPCDARVSGGRPRTY